MTPTVKKVNQIAYIQLIWLPGLDATTFVKYQAQPKNIIFNDSGINDIFNLSCSLPLSLLSLWLSLRRSSKASWDTLSDFFNFSTSDFKSQLYDKIILATPDCPSSFWLKGYCIFLLPIFYWKKNWESSIGDHENLFIGLMWGIWRILDMGAIFVICAIGAIFLRGNNGIGESAGLIQYATQLPFKSLSIPFSNHPRCFHK